MKRFVVFLSGLLVLPAFAEVAPVYYDDMVEYTDEMLQDADAVVDEEETTVVTPANKNVSKRGTINRSTSRAITSATAGSQRNDTSSRAVASSPRNAQNTSRGTVSRATKANTIAKKLQQSSQTRSVSARGTSGAKPVTARIGTTGSVMPATRTTSGTTVSTLTDSGDSLYKGRNVSTRRATVRSASTLASTTPIITEEDVSSTTSNLTAIAELTDYCKAQYAACMDNYCNVLDDNQGRCSCSKNIKNYEKIEQALTTATENFQEVVQKIKYIGLSADQINSLFAETEAELTMKSNSDKSQIRSSLDSIKKKIVDASSPSASSYTSAVSMDMSGLLNFDSTAGFDLASFLGNSGGSSSVSNQRGEQLFKTATARCKTAVLNSCTAQGIDANVITNSYDLEIDKQCMAYERNLNEANAEMRSNVSNAANILQQARLMLAQNKNAYDVRGCVAALDSCMQDEYVCGDDYELCLDPTGKYLASGEIVKGGAPGISGGTPKNSTPLSSATEVDGWTSGGMYGLYATWNYGSGSNAWSMGSSENLNNYINEKVLAWESNYTSNSTTDDDMATYLLQKIGYIDKDNKVHGMCASVMKQCQDYTFSTNKSSAKYKPDNEVIRQYLASALTKIKLQQDSILADYAEDCRSDVSSCLSTNGYDENNPTITTSKTAINACRAEITTCMSVGGYQPTNMGKLTLREMTDWVASILVTCTDGYYLDDGDKAKGYGNTSSCLVCPQVDFYKEAGQLSKKITDTLVSDGTLVNQCVCPEGYYSYRTNGALGDVKGDYPDTFPAECIAEGLAPSLTADGELNAIIPKTASTETTTGG